MLGSTKKTESRMNLDIAMIIQKRTLAARHPSRAGGAAVLTASLLAFASWPLTTLAGSIYVPNGSFESPNSFKRTPTLSISDRYRLHILRFGLP